MDINQENYRQGSEEGRSPAYLGSEKQKNSNPTCFPPWAMIMLDF